MRVDQVLHMHIVAHAGAVGRGVIGAEDGHRVPLALRRLDCHGHQVRLGRVVLAQQAGAV